MMDLPLDWYGMRPVYEASLHLPHVQISGDSQAAVASIAYELDISPDWYWAARLPIEKAAIIEDIQRRHGGAIMACRPC